MIISGEFPVIAYTGASTRGTATDDRTSSFLGTLPLDLASTMLRGREPKPFPATGETITGIAVNSISLGRNPNCDTARAP